MSKAFTKEDDDAPDRPGGLRLPSTLPPGSKNYLTPDGAHQLERELAHLQQVERPQAIGKQGDTVSISRLLALDQRIHIIQHILGSAEVVPPPPATEDRIRFGATVTVRDSLGDKEHYRIVGVNETDLDRNWVSWVSPIAKALLNHRVGDRVRFKLPAGERELEIIAITYE